MVTLRRKNNKWIEIDFKEKVEGDLTFDGRLREICDLIKGELKKDKDVCFLITGSVGSGKSTLARILARYVSEDEFRPKDHIVVDVEDIPRVLRKVKKYATIIFDEASIIFSSTDTLTKETKYAQRVLDVCRQKNLFLVVVAPSFKRLKESIALERSKALIRVYEDVKTGRRGRFAFYGMRGKQLLYREMKRQGGNPNKFRPKYRGTFSAERTYEEDYRKVKDLTFNKVLDSFAKAKEKPPSPSKIRDEFIDEMIIKNPDKLQELVNHVGLKIRALQFRKARLKKEGKIKNE